MYYIYTTCILHGYYHATPCHDMPCYAMICHAMPCHAMPCYAMQQRVLSCHVISCHVASCHVMPGHVLSCHVMTSHVIPWRVTPCRSYHSMPCHEGGGGRGTDQQVKDSEVRSTIDVCEIILSGFELPRLDDLGGSADTSLLECIHIKPQSPGLSI